MDRSTPSSSIHRILQARVLEWVTEPSSRGKMFPDQGLNSCLLSLLPWQVDCLPLVPPGRLHKESLLDSTSKERTDETLPKKTWLVKIITASDDHGFTVAFWGKGAHAHSRETSGEPHGLIWSPGLCQLVCLGEGELPSPHEKRRFDHAVKKIPWRRAWQPTPVSLPGESHGQRSLVGYSLWCHKESDMKKKKESDMTEAT